MSLSPEIPELALSIRQPWAWLIVNGHKDVENRSWRTKFRGLVAIHAGKKEDIDCQYALTCHDGPRHPVTGAMIAIDTGSKLIDSNSHWETFSAPDWSEARGGIVGIAEIVDCVNQSDSSWFEGEFGFVIRNARPVPFIPCSGALGFFNWRKRK